MRVDSGIVQFSLQSRLMSRVFRPRSTDETNDGLYFTGVEFGQAGLQAMGMDASVRVDKFAALARCCPT